MARNMKTFYQPDSKQPKRIMQKQPRYKENTTRLYPTNRPQNKFKKYQGIIIKISSYLNKTAKAQNITTFDKTKCIPNKTFRTLNHPYTMKIALIKRNLRKNSTTPNHKSSTTKETY
jgi:hypothetical protein